MYVCADLRGRAARWAELKRWERRELGQALRRLGLSYREIGAIIPVSKGTLSAWCRDLSLPPAQAARLNSIRGDRRQVGAELRRRAVQRAQAIRSAARAEVPILKSDPRWIAGAVAYWAEGSKTSGLLSFSNSDPALIKLFIHWALQYLSVGLDRLTIGLHLHAGQTEGERRAFWSEITGLPLHHFRKTFIKPEGTGHRKNVLYQGTANIRVRRSGDLLHRVMGWIDGVADDYPGVS